MADDKRSDKKAPKGDKPAAKPASDKQAKAAKQPSLAQLSQVRPTTGSSGEPYGASPVWLK